jgi:RHS repeat-associated protein
LPSFSCLPTLRVKKGEKGVTHSFVQLGMSDAIGTTAFTYTPGQQLASESGPWASDTVSYTYMDRLRTVLDLQQPSASAWVQNYGYDLAYRMTGITSPAGTFAYTYNPGTGGVSAASSLIGRLTLPNGAWITNTFDNNGRMLGTWLTNSSSNIDSSVYTYNVGNQRTMVTRTSENTADYTYDAIGEVASDLASEVSGGATRYNEQLHYVFDPAGNLAYRTNNTLVENFSVNTVNELTANTNGGKLTVMGTTTSPASNVTVNGTNTASLYNDATFAATGFPFLSSYTAVASDSLGRHSTNTVNANIATDNTAYVYDGNGNLTYDGTRNFAYDDENQLIQVYVSNQWCSQFTYDGKLRRRIRQEYTWNGQWVQTNAVYYVYDGNTVIQERAANNTPTTTYTRGLDLSASLQGAGGIGGLLAMILNTSPGPSSSNSYYYHSDGNGNVTMLINSSQAIVAKYLYDAFGNTLSAAGSLAQANLYRFSSKEAHLNSGLVYYLYRYYDPNLQRWPNRDPIQELGGINIYQFVGNSPICFIDSDGQGVLALPGFLAGAGAGTGAATATGTATGVGIGTVATGAAGLLGATTILAGGAILAGGYGQGLQSPVTYPGDIGTPPGNPIPTSVTGPSLPTTVPTATQDPGSTPPFQGEPGSTAVGGTQSTQYGPDGYPIIQRDGPHPGEPAPANGDHCHDWSRPTNGGPPKGPPNQPNPFRGPTRLPQPGDPPPPRGPNVPPPAAS